MQVLCEHNKNIIDITASCTEMTFSETLNEGASSLEIKYIADNLILDNGDVIRVTGKTQDDGIFFGSVFSVNIDASQIISVKAYDQLRYMKAKDIVVIENPKLEDVVKYACEKLSLKMGSISTTKTTLNTIARYDKSYLDLINDGINENLTKNGDYYCLRDEYGSIKLLDIKNLQIPLLIGDDSLATGFTYQKSIDDDYYNVVKILYKDESLGKNELVTKFDNEAVNKFGILQYLEFVDSIGNKEEANKNADDLLRLYNHETESLKLECIGDLRVRAGNSIYAGIKAIGLAKRLIVKSVSHTLIPVHTMNIEVITE